MNRFKKLYGIACVGIKYYYYLIYCKAKNLENKNVWLISERGSDARDNSYHMFKYVRKNYPNIDIKYVITKDSADYAKVKNLGDVIEFGSKEHYILLITAGVLISTHVMGFTPEMSLFWRLDKYHLLKFYGKTVFLQHGIIKDFLYNLTASVSNFDLFICGAKQEYDYILDNFGYDTSVVKHTGLARYDGLVNKPKNQILVMPSFRKWLNYTNDFENSEYFKMFNNLLNNKTLNDLLIKYDYKLVFYPHYEMQKYIGSFKSKNKNIIIADFADYDVQKLLIESRLLITDYSSVFFDFAYMKKPVIYYQFDVAKFREFHYSEAYFSYTDDGFGSVFDDEHQVISQIQQYFKSNFKVEDKYIKRTKSFFVFSDKNNCERIYRAINRLLES